MTLTEQRRLKIGYELSYNAAKKTFEVLRCGVDKPNNAIPRTRFKNTSKGFVVTIAKVSK